MVRSTTPVTFILKVSKESAIDEVFAWIKRIHEKHPNAQINVEMQM